MSTRLKFVLFFVVLVLPALASLLTTQVAFSRASSIEFCGSCHTMTPWFDNVTNPESDSLAAEHYKRRWIQHEQCFTCHSNYGFLGPIEAKINGVRHVAAFYLGFRGRIELYEEFPNGHCLKCHQEAKGFLEDSNHDPLEDILSGKDRCVECHENIHGIEQDDDGPVGYVNGVKIAAQDAPPADGAPSDKAAPENDSAKDGDADKADEADDEDAQ